MKELVKRLTLLAVSGGTSPRRAPRVIAALLIILSGLSIMTTLKGSQALSAKMQDLAREMPIIRPVADFFTSYASPQSVAITMRETVSDCYFVSGVSKRTVSVEVSWTGLSDNDTITVSLPGSLNGVTSRIITQKSTQGSLGGQTVSPIVTPQVVAFEIPSTFSGTLTASGPSGAAANPITITRTGTCEPRVCAPGTLGGMVFADYNRDGIKQDTEYSGVAGVKVTAYSKRRVTFSATSNEFGVWCMQIPSERYPVRLEFENIPPEYAGGRSTVIPSNSSGEVVPVVGRTSMGIMQFISAPSQTVDLGVVDPRDYCQADPYVYAPCYVMNDPLPGASGVKDFPVLIRIPYSAVNVDPLLGAWGGGANPKSSQMQSIASAKELGSVWSVAYHRQRKLLFVGATLRRHSGYGPKGLGGIYVVDPTGTGVTGYGSGASGNVKDSFSVESDLNVPVQNPASPIGGALLGPAANTGRGLPSNNGGRSNDSDAFDALGKVGLGGMAISEDGGKLYFVNQYDKKLYWIDISGYDGTSATRPAASAVSSVAIPNPGCTGGAWRPSGVKVRKGGDVYVSGVCDAQTSQLISDLRGSVQAFNHTTSAWRSIFDFPLTYPKGASISQRGWKPWQSTFSALLTMSGGSYVQVAQPMFTDIAFDVDGAMVLGFNDRSGMQTASPNYGQTGSSDIGGYVGGDLLRAFFSGSAFVLENNAKAGPNNGSAPNNYEGPGFGEFYFDNWSSTGHSETFTGGIAIRPGSGEVISSAMDPVNSSIVASGLRINSNLTGAATKGIAVYTSGDGSHGTQYVGKSTGIGDVELACELGGDLELGNRIWFDENGNGNQEMAEPGVGTAALKRNGQPHFAANVPVQLWKGSTQVGQTTANADGYYLFNSKNVNMNGATKILENTDYEIRIDMNVVTGNAFKLIGVSKKDNIAGATGDQRDSDAELINGFAVIKVRTGGPGEVEHKYDFGFTRYFLMFEMSAIGNEANDAPIEGERMNQGTGPMPVMTGGGAGTTPVKGSTTPTGQSTQPGQSNQPGQAGKLVTAGTEATSYMVPKCLTPGGLTESMATFMNPTPVTVPLSRVYLDVSPTVSAVYYPSAKMTTSSGSIISNPGTIQMVGNRIVWDGSIGSMEKLTITYFVQAGDYNPGTQICTTGIIYWDSDNSGAIDENADNYQERDICAPLNCPRLGAGDYPSSVTALADQKPGSVLIYNLYSSSVNTQRENSRITLTNVHPVLTAYVHLFFIDGTSCSVADRLVTLTANQTVSMLMSDEDPGVTGYAIAVSVDDYGCPNSFNYLVGETLVKMESGFSANLPAVGVSAVLGGLPKPLPCDSTWVSAVLRFDGVSYMGLPRTLAVSSLMPRADGSQTLLVLNRLGGSMMSGVPTVGQLNGLLFDDAETSASFALTGNNCQLRGIINNNFPRTAPRYDQLIPAGRTGWMKFSTSTDTGLTGSVITYNPTTNFSSGHNLHTLSTTNSVQITIPVYPPNF